MADMLNKKTTVLLSLIITASAVNLGAVVFLKILADFKKEPMLEPGTEKLIPGAEVMGDSTEITDGGKRIIPPDRDYEEAGEEVVEVSVFFPMRSDGTERTNCAEVFPVMREVPATRRAARDALLELLVGPTGPEEKSGFYSAINPGMELNGISIQHGVAFVDFGQEFEDGVDDFCRAETIRSQIEKTLFQFSTVDELQLYVGGKTGNVFQSGGL